MTRVGKNIRKNYIEIYVCLVSTPFPCVCLRFRDLFFQGDIFWTYTMSQSFWLLSARMDWTCVVIFCSATWHWIPGHLGTPAKPVVSRRPSLKQLPWWESPAKPNLLILYTISLFRPNVRFLHQRLPLCNLIFLVPCQPWEGVIFVKAELDRVVARLL